MAPIFESNFSIRKILGNNEEHQNQGTFPPSPPHQNEGTFPPSPPLSDGSISPDLLNQRPGFTFSALIAMAIRSSLEKRLPLSAILDWISKNFPYYRRDQASWQTQIRHTLSTNSCFSKIPRPLDDPGRGNYWIISRDIEDVKVSLSTGRLETNVQGNFFSQFPLDGYGNQLNQVITRGVPMNHPQSSNAVYFPSPEELGMAQQAMMMQALQEQQIWYLFHQKQQQALQQKLINLQQQQHFRQQYDQLYQQMMFHQQQCEFMMAKQLPM